MGQAFLEEIIDRGRLSMNSIPALSAQGALLAVLHCTFELRPHGGIVFILSSDAKFRMASMIIAAIELIELDPTCMANTISTLRG